jgi:hypothetical protein
MKVSNRLISANKGILLLAWACFMAQPVLSTEKQDDAQGNTNKRVRFTEENLCNLKAEIEKSGDFGKIFDGTVKILASKSLADNYAYFLYWYPSNSPNSSNDRHDKFEPLKLCQTFSELFIQILGKEEAPERFLTFFHSLETLQKYRAHHSKTGLMGEAESNENERLTKDTLAELRKIDAVGFAYSFLTNFKNSKNRHDNIEKNTKAGSNLSSEFDIFPSFQKDQKDLSEKLLGLTKKQGPLARNRTYDAEKHKEICKKYQASELCLKINFLKDLRKILTKNLSVISEFESDHREEFCPPNALNIRESLGIRESLDIGEFLKQLEKHIDDFEQRKDKESYAESIYNEMKHSGTSLNQIKNKEKFYQYIKFKESYEIMQLMNRVPLLKGLLFTNKLYVINNNPSKTEEYTDRLKEFAGFVSSKTGITETRVERKRDTKATEKQGDPQINTKQKENLCNLKAKIEKNDDFGKIFNGIIKILAPKSLANNFARCLLFQYSGKRVDKFEPLKICEAFSELLTDTFGKKGAYEDDDKGFLEAFLTKDAHERFPTFFHSLETLQKYRAHHSKTGLMGEAESNENERLTKYTLAELRKIDAVGSAYSFLTNFKNLENRHDNIEKNTKAGSNLSSEFDIFPSFQKDQKDLSEELLGLIEKQTPLAKNRTYDAEKHKEICKKYKASELCLKINFLKDLRKILTKNLSVISEFEAGNSVKVPSESGLTMGQFLEQLSTHIYDFENRKSNDKLEYALSIYNEMQNKNDSFNNLNWKVKEKFYQYIKFKESYEIIQLMNRVPLLKGLLFTNKLYVINNAPSKTEEYTDKLKEFARFVSSKTGITETRVERKRDTKAKEKQGTGSQRPSIAITPTSQRPEGRATSHMVEDDKTPVSKDNLPNSAKLEEPLKPSDLLSNLFPSQNLLQGNPALTLYQGTNLGATEMAKNHT